MRYPFRRVGLKENGIHFQAKSCTPKGECGIISSGRIIPFSRDNPPYLLNSPPPPTKSEDETISWTEDTLQSALKGGRS
jgi:hypothetical protein